MDDHGLGVLNRDAFHAGFAADLSEADATFMADSQVPVNMAVFGEAVTTMPTRGAATPVGPTTRA